MVQTLSRQAIYHQLGSLLTDVPGLQDFDEEWNLPPATIRWLSQATALVNAAVGLSSYSVRIDAAVQNLVATMRPRENSKDILLVMNQVLAILELELPAGAQGAFVATGSSMDAYAALSKIVGAATTNVLIVDPYMDATAVIEVAGLAPESVNIDLLSDAVTVKPTLKPAADKWIQQYGKMRPLQVRLAPAKTLHDRLVVVDGKEAWILTQSLKDFAQRSPATIQRADTGLAILKVQAFGIIWNAATLIA